MKTNVKRHKVIQPLGENYRLIPLTRKQNAIVDTEDFDQLSQFNWYAEWSPATRSFYAARRDENGKYVCMHRFILKLIGKPQADHKNGNTLDNRKENLRPCTAQQNRFNQRRKSNNTSGFKGVSKSHKLQKWWSYIRIDGRTLHLGYYTSKPKAARVYDAAARKHFGEFARTNF
jgi:hypothetical protein